MKFIIESTALGHPRVLKCGPAAFGMWTLAGLWLARYPDQNGRIPAGLLPMLGGDSLIADELVKAGLWRRAKGGYRMLQEVTSFDSDAPDRKRPLFSFSRDDYRRKIPLRCGNSSWNAMRTASASNAARTMT